MKFDTIEWSFSLCEPSFADKMREWLDKHQNAEIIDISYKTATNERGLIINMIAFILYRED